MITSNWKHWCTWDDTITMAYIVYMYVHAPCINQTLVLHDVLYIYYYYYYAVYFFHTNHNSYSQ